MRLIRFLEHLASAIYETSPTFFAVIGFCWSLSEDPNWKLEIVPFAATRPIGFHQCELRVPQLIFRETKMRGPG